VVALRSTRNGPSASITVVGRLEVVVVVLEVVVLP
jgi:hypothetical protein